MILRLMLQLSLFLQCAWVTALLSNRTIDDTYGDSETGAMPIYTPDDVWDDASCSPFHCKVLPPPVNAFRQNYHAATYVGDGARTVTLHFRGTAIYVFFILANSVPGGWTTTLCGFALDDQPVEQFSHEPSTSPDYQYQALVYHKTDLANVEHTLNISANDYSTKSFINFDYAIYTFDDGVTDTIAQQSSTTSEPGGTLTLATTTVPAPQVLTTTTTTFNLSKSLTPSPSSGTISSSSSSPSLSPSISTIGTTSRTSETIGATSLPFAAPSTSNNDNTTASPGSSNGTINQNPVSKVFIGAIAGGVVGGFVLIIVIVIFLLRCRRRRELRAAHGFTPQQLDVTQFTQLSPTESDIETRSQEAVPFFAPVRKQQEAVVTMPEPQNNQFPEACATTGSDVSQDTVNEKRSDLGTDFTVSEDHSSGLRHIYQAMRAEILSLRAQLDATSGFTDELPPEYSRT